MQPNLLQRHRKKCCFFESQNAAPPFSALIADHAQFSLAKLCLIFIWARLRSVVCPCERVGAGVGFFRQVGGFERSGSLAPGAWSGLCRALSRVSGSGFAMSVCGFDGVERWRALLWRSFIGSDRQVFRARRQDQRKNIAVFANGMTLPRLARGEDRLRDSFKKLS